MEVSRIGGCVFLIVFLMFLVIHGKTNRKLNKEGCDKTIRTTRLVRSPRITSANRGKAITCMFHLLKHDFGDLVYELNFKTFHVGLPHNATWCSNAHLQIVDHPSRVNTSGYFCGKLQHGTTFLAETDHLTIVFHADSYTRQTYFRFHTSVLPKRLALERHKEMMLNNPGNFVQGTYCDRAYVNCPGFCDVISPRFPGFYPRNATCRYSVVFNETKNTKVVLGGQYYDNFDVWGGPWPKSHCPSNYCSSNDVSTLCPYDFIQIFDVTPNGQRLMIQRFCGRGHLPRVVSRGNEIQIEFVSAVAGSIANEGFHLSIGPEARQDDSVPGSILVSDSCHFVFDGKVLLQGQFQNLRHWYAPGTRCSYRFVGQPNRHKIFLHFLKFNAYREDLCRSKLTMYDAAGPDGNAIRGVFCGKRQPNETHLSHYENFYVEFDSKMGSYDGTNFEYLVLYAFIDTVTSGEFVEGSACDEIFDSQKGVKSGHFDFFKNRLRLWKRHVTCTFKFQSRSTERIKITITHLKLNPRRQCSIQDRLLCNQESHTSSFDSVTISDNQNAISECLCDPIHTPHNVISTTSDIQIHVHLHNIPTLAYRDYATYSIKGHYEFLQVGCGQSQLKGPQGELTFPTIAPGSLPDRVQCRWTIEIAPKTHLLLKIYQLLLFGNCSSDFLKFYALGFDHMDATSSLRSVENLCRDNVKSEVILYRRDFSETNKIVIELNSSSSARFRLLWSELTTASKLVNEKSYLENPDCEYLCKGGRYCISYPLVCNGVINCPGFNSSWDPLDEGIEACTSISVIMQWVLLTFCSTFVVALLISVALVWREKCFSCRRRASHAINQPTTL